MRRVGLGIVGCGDISPAYLKHLTGALASVVDVKACADLLPERAQARAKEFGVPKACPVAELLADPEIEIAVNLTVAPAHYEVTLAMLEAGKHVFSEKPLALTRDEGRHLLETAAARGLQIAGAPDTFLGAGLQACRKALDDGLIGRPLVAQAFFAMGNHSERYIKVFKGPMLDMGPYYLTALVSLLGPVVRATGTAQIPTPEKPEGDKTYTVDMPTVICGALDFASGCVGGLTVTSELYGYTPRIEIYGTEGMLATNDPNAYTGPVILNPKSGERRELPTAGFGERGRGLGVAEMAVALRAGRPARTSGALMYHVLDLMLAFHDASREGRHVQVESIVERPAPFEVSEVG